EGMTFEGVFGAAGPKSMAGENNDDPEDLGADDEDDAVVAPPPALAPASKPPAAVLPVGSITVAPAQGAGTLRARVIDNADKTPVIGAAVTLSNTNNYVATTSIATQPDGTATFSALQAGGGYVIQVVMD